MPKISVIMPVYNSEKYLSEAIDSILNQTYEDFEFIIIDDGSTDSSQEIVRSYTDPRIRFYINEHNMGVAATLNRGLDLATGEYIARMDSDDISLPERFEKQAKFLNQKSNIGILGSWTIVFGDEIYEKEFHNSTKYQETKAELFFNNAVGHSTVMLRKSILDHYNLKYELEYNGLEDYVLWWRMAEFCEICSYPEVLLKYRIHNKQVTQTDNKKDDFKIKYMNFMAERAEKVGINDRTYLPLLYKVCQGKQREFTEIEYINILQLFKRLIVCNKETSFLPTKEFRNLCGAIALAIILKMDISKQMKWNLKLEAYKCGVIPAGLLLKNIISSTLYMRRD